MPSADQLPKELKALPGLNALSIGREPGFHADMSKLIDTLWEIFRSDRSVDEPPL
jgi:hypothetical protein